ncbi:MAG: hypothetical protein P4L96_15930 [Rhodoferax sp.]|nr:hypothetical protein [Rhodoferax sp.]
MQGQLFTQNFLTRGVAGTPSWQELGDSAFAAFKATLQGIFRGLDELDNPARTLTLTADDFLRVNPNTGAAPIFRSRRDADITLALHAQHPVLVKHGEVSASTGQQPDARVWPVRYATMFHMTNDSSLLLKAAELKQQGFEAAALNRWRNAAGAEAAQQEAIDAASKTSPDRYPAPPYWVSAADVDKTWSGQWCIAYKSVTTMRQAQLMNGHHAHPSVADFVVPQMLALSYTAHDLAPFARGWPRWTQCSSGSTASAPLMRRTSWTASRSCANRTSRRSAAGARKRMCWRGLRCWRRPEFQAKSRASPYEICTLRSELSSNHA